MKAETFLKLTLCHSSLSFTYNRYENVLESVGDRAPLAVRNLHLHASGGHFLRISTIFEYQPALGGVVRRFGS